MQLYILTSTNNPYLILNYCNNIDYISIEKGKLLETIDLKLMELLNKNNQKLKDIQNIIISDGPGNFLSLKIGASFAYGLSKILNISLSSLSSFDILFYNTTSLDLKLINASKNEYYLQYQNIKKIINKNEINDFIEKFNVKNIYKNENNIIDIQQLLNFLPIIKFQKLSNIFIELNYIKSAV